MNNNHGRDRLAAYATGNAPPARQESAAPMWPRLLGTLGVAFACSVCVLFITLPLLALLMRVPLDSLWGYLGSPLVAGALRLSAISSLSSLLLMVLLGTPLAYMMARFNFRGKAVLETIVEVPLVLPPAVAGLALLLAFGRRSPLGGLLQGLNMEIAFTLAAVVLAQTFVAAPFYIKAARVAFQGVPRDLMEVARTYGAGNFQVFRHIVLPLALPGIAGGAVMGWSRAVGEFGATILFAGNFQDRTQTMPLAIYSAFESDLNAAIVLAAILVIISFSVLLSFKLLSGRSLDVMPD